MSSSENILLCLKISPVLSIWGPDDEKHLKEPRIFTCLRIDMLVVEAHFALTLDNGSELQLDLLTNKQRRKRVGYMI